MLDITNASTFNVLISHCTFRAYSPHMSQRYPFCLLRDCYLFEKEPLKRKVSEVGVSSAHDITSSHIST